MYVNFIVTMERIRLSCKIGYLSQDFALTVTVPHSENAEWLVLLQPN